MYSKRTTHVPISPLDAPGLNVPAGHDTQPVVTSCRKYPAAHTHTPDADSIVACAPHCRPLTYTATLGVTSPPFTDTNTEICAPLMLDDVANVNTNAALLELDLSAANTIGDGAEPFVDTNT